MLKVFLFKSMFNIHNANIHGVIIACPLLMNEKRSLWLYLDSVASLQLEQTKLMELEKDLKAVSHQINTS